MFFNMFSPINKIFVIDCLRLNLVLFENCNGPSSDIHGIIKNVISVIQKKAKRNMYMPKTVLASVIFFSSNILTSDSTRIKPLSSKSKPAVM